jgi:hypothetical protein
MKRILKYPLKIVDQQELVLYADSKILSVENQNESIVLYALVEDCVRGIETHTVIIHGTGHDANDTVDCDFIGTVNMHSGRLMFHVFARRI